MSESTTREPKELLSNKVLRAREKKKSKEIREEYKQSLIESFYDLVVRMREAKITKRTILEELIENMNLGRSVRDLQFGFGGQKEYWGDTWLILPTTDGKEFSEDDSESVSSSSSNETPENGDDSM